MSINLSQHKADLLKAYDSVVDTKNSTNWALFTYDGNSNVLKYVDSGDGGLDDVSAQFNSGKIMYALCQVKEPTTGLPKLMLIHWQGEGVQTTRLGACASHIYEVQKFFKGIHLTHYARNEDDVEPDVLMSAIKKVSYGAKIIPASDSAHEPSYVGSVYQRVNPSRDINAIERDKFWSKAEKEEAARLEEEKRRISDEKQRVEEEKRRLQERLTDECQKDIEQVKRKSLVGSEALRKERLQEVKEVIKPQSGLKAMWEQKTSIPVVEQPKSPDRDVAKSVVKKPWPPMPSRESFDADVQQTSPTFEKTSPTFEKTSPTFEKTSPVGAKQFPRTEIIRSPMKETPHEYEKVTRNGAYHNGREYSAEYGARNDTVLSPPTISPPPPPLPQVEEIRQAPFKMVVPPRAPDSDEEEEQQDWESPPLEDQPVSPAAPISPRRSTGDKDIMKNPALGIQAKALWDYEASDDTEIRFDPGDVITHIEFIDEGWWRGRGVDGKFGLFPANYVELLE